MLCASLRAVPGRRKEVSSLLRCDVITHAVISISRRLGHIKCGSAGRTGSDEDRWQHMNAPGSRYDRLRSCSDCVSTILTPGLHHEITCRLRPSAATWYASSSQGFDCRLVPFRAGWQGSPERQKRSSKVFESAAGILFRQSAGKTSSILRCGIFPSWPRLRGRTNLLRNSVSYRAFSPVHFLSRLRQRGRTHEKQDLVNF